MAVFEDVAEDVMAQRLRQYVLYYREKGLVILPLCWPIKKKGEWVCGCGGCVEQEEVGVRPLVPFSEALEKEDVLHWWDRWPLANIGLLLRPSGFIAVELRGEEPHGLADMFGLPATRVCEGDRRASYLYRYPPEADSGVVPRAFRLGPLCSIRTEGICVLPPSRGRRGSFADWKQKAPSSVAPTWLLERLSVPVANEQGRGCQQETPQAASPSWEHHEPVREIVSKEDEEEALIRFLGRAELPHSNVRMVDGLPTFSLSSGPSEVPVETPEEGLSFGPLRVFSATKEAFLAGRDLELTRCEWSILWALLANPGQAVSYEDLVLAYPHQTRGSQPPCSESIAKSRICTLRKKLTSIQRHKQLTTRISIRCKRLVGYFIQKD